MQQNNRSKELIVICISRKSLLIIYQIFVCSHVDYADIMYDKSGNVNFESKLETVQCKANLVCVIQGTNRGSISMQN